MGNTLIKVNCIDQRLIVSNNPLIAAGGKNEDRMEITFCSLWEGFEKTAVFYRDVNKAVYHIPIEDDACIIPHEVLADEGWMYFGVFGTLDDVRRTTAIVKYHIERGAITGYGLPSDPTSDIYAQYLAQVLRAETAASNAETAASNANNAAERADAAASNAETAASNSVRYDAAQTLNGEQQNQARVNIGAASGKEVIELKGDLVELQLFNGLNDTNEKTLYDICTLVTGGLSGLTTGSQKYRVATKLLLYIPCNLELTALDNFYVGVVTKDNSQQGWSWSDWKSKITINKGVFCKLQLRRKTEISSEDANVEEFGKAISVKTVIDKKFKDIDDKIISYSEFGKNFIINATNKIATFELIGNSLRIKADIDLYYIKGNIVYKNYRNNDTYKLDITLEHNNVLIWDLDTNDVYSIDNVATKPTNYCILANNYDGMCQNGYFLKDFIYRKSVDDFPDITRYDNGLKFIPYNIIPFKKISIRGTEQDYSMIGNNYISVQSGNNELTTQGHFYISNSSGSLLKTINHYIGHCASIDYNESLDILLVGNGSISTTHPAKLYLIPNFSTISDGTTITENDCVVLDVSQYGNGACGTFLNDNQIALIVNKNNTDYIHRLLVDISNGTYTVISNHCIDNFIIGTAQGCCYHDGKVWISINRDSKGIVFVGIQLSYTDSSYRIVDGYGFEQYENGEFKWAECEGMCFDRDGNIIFSTWYGSGSSLNGNYKLLLK